MPDKPDVEASRQLFSRLSQCAIKLDRSAHVSVKSRFVKLMPAFKSFIESIEKMLPAKIQYDRLMANYLFQGAYTLQHGVIVWHASCANAKHDMTDKLHRIDSLRSKMCDDARVIMTITDN